MTYKIKKFEDRSCQIDDSNELKLTEVEFSDDDIMGDNDEPACSIMLDYDTGIKKEQPLMGFSFGLKEAIRLRNALNGFIEINKS